MDFAAAYAETRDHLVDLVAPLSEERLRTPVPASPAWDVRDVVAHLTGIARDLTVGTVPADLRIADSLWDAEQAMVRDDLTAGQVAARRGRPVADVLAEWSDVCDDLLPMLRGERVFPMDGAFVEPIVVTDLSVHAQDVRGALGVPGDRRSAAVGVALASYTVALAIKLRRAGLPALRLRYEGKERVAGDGEPGASVAADRFELVRALSGRRSRDQIRVFDWEGDPEPYLALIPAYGERLDPIHD
jgi:uncharacterized protein (TIGR03083 family)